MQIAHDNDLPAPRVIRNRIRNHRQIWSPETAPGFLIGFIINDIRHRENTLLFKTRKIIHLHLTCQYNEVVVLYSRESRYLRKRTKSVYQTKKTTMTKLRFGKHPPRKDYRTLLLRNYVSAIPAPADKYSVLDDVYKNLGS